ncbi:MAG: DUF1289 domain-containing protein [Rhodospirillaceae bacterium]|jgi:uncharacterized protein|nr:DUF1289 domain-containing protein [Rhodospirillaceae bacterium]MBT5241527.1 DUF1289 domain-containing protein [Rhodospirillaceae bacterium]MBT5566203.1 DUF1289 domain-containing protein [Rhodospirillaceae bacterium]MBT6088921.1 DUF1289 domain-containing protein [Rhodospirillaceae bacterium]MBT7451947.1 DUF1289 domain-containing protein [Rhodospirillaceae bacterium]
MSDTSNPASNTNPDDLPASPCVGVCTVDKETKMCIGCLRTLKEIGAWRTMTLDQKRDVVAACKRRADEAQTMSGATTV